LATVNSAEQANQLLSRDDLPNIQVYDKGYFDDGGTFHLYIPTGTVILIGRREDGAPLGEFQLTRNANNPGSAPGPYTRLWDSADHLPPPRSVQVHAGFNGGPALKFPSGVVAMTVT
jgi:hypothetical protein